MGTVSKLNKNDADILHHRHNHLRKFRPAPLSYRAGTSLSSFDTPSANSATLLPEKLFHVLIGGGGIFNHVMQQGRPSTFRSRVSSRPECGHRYRVRDIGFTSGRVCGPRERRAARYACRKDGNLVFRQVGLKSVDSGFQKQIQGRPAL